MAGRFKLDENLPRAAATLFTERGYEVETVLGERLGGEIDSRVFDASRAEGRILVTLDLDFADIQRYPPSSHPGIWVLRHRSLSVENILRLLKDALTLLDAEPVSNRLWIVEPGRVRIHE